MFKVELLADTGPASIPVGEHNGPVLPCINLSQQITGLDLLLAFRGGSCPRHRDLGEVQKRMIGYVMLTRNDFIFYEET